MPLIATVFLVGIAAGGWNLFSREPEVVPVALAGDHAVLPAQKDVSSAAAAAPGTGGGAPVLPDGGVPLLPPDVAGAPPGAVPPPAVEFDDPARVAAPEPKTAVQPAEKGGGPLALLNLPKLLPKEATELNLLNLPVADLNWGAVARCESNNDPERITTSGLYGLYQFSRETWESVGGTGLPSHATPEEQTRRAQLLYEKQNGWQTTCGKLLYSDE